MRNFGNIVILFSMPWVFPSCIEGYTPDIEAGESSKYVVYGELTTEGENHHYIYSIGLAY